MKLEIKDIKKSYKTKESLSVLKGVSFTAEAGDFIALKGLSGSGKSTLLSIIGGMLHPDSGEVSLDGDSLYSQSQSDSNKIRAEKIGFLFQQFHLIPYLSIEENILAPSLALEQSGVETKAADLIKKFGLEGRRTHKPSELSTGEMQRCAMARALITSPTILLADEPTGNLDDENSSVILDSLSEFAKSGGIVIMVTHDSRAAKEASRVLSISEGQINE